MNGTAKTLQDIYDFSTRDLSARQKALIKKAYDFAENAHKDQKRKSGEPYFIHLVATAGNLAKLGLGSRVIAAGILHDSVEDGVATEEQLKEEFGEEIAFLVDGVTKLGHVKYQGMQRHNESLRKLFVATSKDVRVLIIKFADRIHNMQTLEHVRPDKRVRIATETLEIYAPLAYRLGITTLSKQLEDLSFPYVYPTEYLKVKNILKERSTQTLSKLDRVDKSIKKKMAEEGMKDFRTTHRIKGLYSLYKKLIRKKWNSEAIYDIAALRVIVSDVTDCYLALGIIHQNYRPMPGRIKDYIAFPKPNGYQSLHTTVFTGDGGQVEIQIRTEKMHQEAEFGAASHIGYKQGTEGQIIGVSQKDSDWVSKLTGLFKKPSSNARSPEWMKSLVEHSDGSDEATDIKDLLKQDFFTHRIFAFTPMGEVIDLPEDSTPIDFAFQIHTDIGMKISGAKVHGKFVSLDTKLQNGDIVEIITSNTAKPNKKWLDFVKTKEAERKIRNFTE